MDEMKLDRRVSAALMSALKGPLSSLISRRNENPMLLDLQLRRHSTEIDHSWASLYVGLSTVLDVHVRVTNVWDGPGSFWLETHETYRTGAGFNKGWGTPMSIEELGAKWTKVESYLDRAITSVKRNFTDKEGKVHAAMCSARATSYRVIDREPAPSFGTSGSEKAGAVKKRIISGTGAPLWAAVAADPCTEKWWPSVRYAKPKNFGTSPDLIAIDDAGRLLVIEAKPSTSTDGITWGPAQLRFYADLFAELFRSSPTAEENLVAMLQQRVDLGLTTPGRVDLASPLRIVPVLAVGAGRVSREAIKRATMVQEAIDARAKATSPVAKTEFWMLDPDGEPSALLV